MCNVFVKETEHTQKVHRSVVSWWDIVFSVVLLKYAHCTPCWNLTANAGLNIGVDLFIEYTIK